MKYIKFIGSLLLTILIFYIFNTKLGSIPPIGKFLSPSQGVWQNETNEEIDGSPQIVGLSEEVKVHYDDQLIPHIFAQNDLRFI